MKLSMHNWGRRPSPNPPQPAYSTTELASELGISMQTLRGYMHRVGAPKPVMRGSMSQRVNRGTNYYNRQEVLAFLRQIGVLK